jgi:Arc/MetJ-type ribon-helix-helix transcriptional regulator
MRVRKRRDSDKLSVSLPKDMVVWLRQEAASSDAAGNISAVLRRLLWAAYQEEQRRASIAKINDIVAAGKLHL